jgi:hypothetical protein
VYLSMSNRSEVSLVLIRRSTSFGSRWNTICPLMRKMKSEALRPAASAGVPGLTVLTFNIKVVRVESVTFCYPFILKVLGNIYK